MRRYDLRWRCTDYRCGGYALVEKEEKVSKKTGLHARFFSLHPFLQKNWNEDVKLKLRYINSEQCERSPSRWGFFFFCD
jgi:hypothetical protein